MSDVTNQSLKTHVKQAINEYKTYSESVIKSGFSNLDKYINGFEEEDLIILAGRPGMGVKDFSVSLLINQANQGNKVLYVANAQSAKMLGRRVISQISGINAHIIGAKNTITKELRIMEDAINQINLENIQITDRVDKVEKLSDIIYSSQPDLVIIDSIEHLRILNGENDYSIDPGSSMRTLSELSSDFKTPVIVLCDVGRNAEFRGGDRRPVLSDLSGPESLESLATKALLLYRPAYYGFIEDEYGYSTAGMAEIIIAKNLYGLSETCRYNYNQFTGKFNETSNG